MSRSLFSLLALAFALPALAQPHVDRKHGYAVTPPVRWTLVPVKVEEKWIVGKWLCYKKYDDQESGYQHQPMLRVIRFEGKDAKSISGDGGKKPIEIKPGDSIQLTSPYKNYKDYLKRNFQGGGFFISKEQEKKRGQIPVTLLEVKIEKLATAGKKRIYAWVFRPEWGGELAIECDALESAVDKLQPVIYAAFSTFRVIKRDPKLLVKEQELETGARLKFTDKEETPAQQKKRRIAAEKLHFKKAIAGLPAGWTVRRTRHFLILNHGKPKFMEKVIAHAEAVRVWLDRTFKDVGTGYVQGSIIRICKDKDEERAFSKGSGDAWSAQTRESVVSEDPEYSKVYEFQYLGQAVMQSWFHDKNEDLYTSMPTWLDRGLAQYVGTAVLKGRLQFEPDQDEKETMREARRQNKLVPLRKLVRMTSKDLWSGKDAAYLDAECVSMTRFLFGPGRANSKLRVLIKDYIKHLLAQLQENDKKARAEVKSTKSGPMTEKEEEEAFKQRKKQDWSASEKQFLEQVYGKTFKGWTEAHWAQFQAAYDRFVK